MSNNTVGAIYRSIIEEVIESSRTDFEEGGVEESVLEDLRQVRCLCAIIVVVIVNQSINQSIHPSSSCPASYFIIPRTSHRSRYDLH